MHRKVDSFAEVNPYFIKSKRLISLERKRFAGIIIDLSFDHFLAKNWNQYSSIDLDNFTRQVYSILQTNTDLYPDKLKFFVTKMSEEDWLGSYQTVEGIGRIMDRVSNRLKVKNTLPGSVEELIKNYEDLEKLFFLFFEDLKKFVHNL